MFDHIEWGLFDGVVISGLRVEKGDWFQSFVGCGSGTGACVAEARGCWGIGGGANWCWTVRLFRPGGQGRIEFVFRRLEMDLYPKNGRFTYLTDKRADERGHARGGLLCGIVAHGMVLCRLQMLRQNRWCVRLVWGYSALRHG